MPARTVDPLELALRAERQYVLALGGFVWQIAGAELVTHEKIPVPRFNFVEVTGLGPGRRTAFFERALDHYFQRAIRPRFRVPLPVEPDFGGQLEGLGFRPASEPWTLMTAAPDRPVAGASTAAVGEATADELSAAVALWAEPKARPEVHAAVEIAWRHPNPGERVTPIVAKGDHGVVAAALRYERDATVGLHWVTTRPEDRGQGVASALVAGGLAARQFPADLRYLFADSERLERRLTQLGFVPARRYWVYDLPPGAELAMPAPGPPGPPTWRPPRG